MMPRIQPPPRDALIHVPRLGVLSVVGFLFSLIFFAKAVYAESVLLAWDPVTYSGLKGYKIHVGFKSGSYSASLNVGNVSTYEVRNLNASITYYFAVTAYDNNGVESPYSNEVVKRGSGGGGIDPPLPLEVGEVKVNHVWKRVSLNKSFTDPVVVAKSLSANGSDPAGLRIRDVDPSGFEIRVEEWDYLDGNHVYELADYMVMERGSYTLSDGTLIKADYFNNTGRGAFQHKDFRGAFHEIPVVVASVTTCNDKEAVTCRLKNISLTGFDCALQEQEANVQNHATETVAFIAWEPSLGAVNGMKFEVAKTDNIVDSNFYTIIYDAIFPGTPLFIADMQTCNGINPATVRWSNKDETGVDVKIAEEQSLDSEVDHAKETVGYMVFQK
jgi:hypothetical protein